MSDLFEFKAPKNQYAVMGNPVAQSRSPLIHEMFAQQCGISLEYGRIQVDVGGFEQAVSHFAAHDGAGLNITVPFKVDAWNLCRRDPNQLSARADLAEAVNTLIFGDHGKIQGDNTDGAGIVRDIEHNLGVTLAQKKILIVGAGGAARGVLGPILESKPATLQIVNRTAEKAITLARRFYQLGFNQTLGSALGRTSGSYDLIINATAASLNGQLPEIDSACVGDQTLAYDMMYGSEPTLFMKWARDQGAGRTADGLGMLVEQAAESFRLWHQQEPDTAPVISYLRKL
ncbi:MAG: shikimate dehydrogenase [Gammaproteobacteria bacterium]